MKILFKITRKFFVLVGMAVSIVLAWMLAVWLFDPPAWLFPNPGKVWLRFVELWGSGSIQHHSWVTTIEIVLGYLCGIIFGFLSGYPISQVRMLERVVTPYLVAANSVPLVAFAPLLLLWFGNGIETKIVVAALIVYFPMTMSIINGFHQQSPYHLRLMRSLHANKWQRFLYLELPSAIPGIISGMKIGAPLAVVGAVVGEFLGTGEGLGHLILEANGLLDTAQLFVAIIILAVIGISFYSVTLGMEAVFLGPWHHKRRQS